MLATLFHACASASFRSSRDSPGRRASRAYVVVGVRALRVNLEVAHLGVEPDVDRGAARPALVPLLAGGAGERKRKTEVEVTVPIVTQLWRME